MVLGDDERAEARAREATKRLVLVVLSGAQIGQRFVLEAARVTIGRGDASDISLEDEGISREHAILERASGSYCVHDAGSTNGLFVNGARTRTTTLEPGDRVGLGADTVLKLQLEDDLDAELEQRIFTAALFDGLTGAFNRASFDRELEAEVARAIRHTRPLSLLMFDLDHFKAVNDTHGHTVGDDVLAEFVARLNAITRSEDCLARFGGEEFVILCSGTTREEALQLAARALDAITSETFLAGDVRLPVSASIGVAELHEQPEPSETALVAAADAALYRAKRRGRARVEI